MVHTPHVIWFTGLSGSGKTTLAFALKEALAASGIERIYHLDGDHLRQGINADLGFSLQDRDENLRRAAHIANLFWQEGYWVLASFITPLNSQQAMIRRVFPAERFLEVHLNTPLATCQQRDPKHLYAKTTAGEIFQMTGVQSPYEPPLAPELRLDTTVLDVEAALERLLTGISDYQLRCPTSPAG
ncbi:adenylyl-sulfate kinase [Marinobacterium weihaiense]|uniref:Adenylyl-sulfate kinase n=1 Tax=Marinobacterium weihaiense TaxID=2851016 RepID=A0ABS6M975_9GAMM|nr:adenylyl-sulfate kinase [Marinobacterium weihaiense]MBV0932327.1 adenylyl-sulfate kinase [Marinobacterium weihaiense]